MMHTGIIMNHAFAQANHWTFEIPEIRQLLDRYVGDGAGWADPFAGESTLAQYRNDMNPERSQPNQLEAVAFIEALKKSGVKLKGGLLDPPYSYRQVSEHYKAIGLKASAMDTSANFVYRVKRAMGPLIEVGGHAISFGWNTSGFGKSLGFEIIEILDVSHGLTHNDTLVTVEKKVLDVVREG